MLIFVACSNPKFPNYKINGWSTHKEDLPDKYNQPEMDYERITKWAASIGEYTAQVIDRIFKSVPIKEKGYNSAIVVNSKTLKKNDCISQKKSFMSMLG